MPTTRPPVIELTAVEFAEQYAFACITVTWDQGEETFGAARITLRLPIDPRHAQDTEALRRAATALATAALDLETLRSWRGTSPQSK